METRLRVRVRTIPALTVAVLAVAALATIASAQAPAPAARSPSTPADRVDMVHAKATFQALCSKCHDPGIATSQNHDRSGWQDVIQRMYGFGLVASEDETKQVVEYLTATYPPADR